MIAQREDVTPRLATLPLDTILHGDCLEVLRGLPDASVDAIVTDPPYGLGAAPDMLEVLRAWLGGEAYTPRGSGGFMGKAWDAFVPGPEYWRECLRVLKPGGHALVFAGTRTWDVMGLALRLAGFEVRDTLQWLYGSGFPKSLDVGKALDKAAGAKRRVIGRHKLPAFKPNMSDWQEPGLITAPATDAARQWDGWGTALKPAWEPVIVCRKPLGEPTVAGNVLAHGTGALNIGASRIGTDSTMRANRASNDGHHWRMGVRANVSGSEAGRWPANLLLSHAPDCGPHGCALWCPVRELDAQSGVRTSGLLKAGTRPIGKRNTFGQDAAGGYEVRQDFGGDTGGASRYFQVFRPEATFRYVAKASRRERNRGCAGLPPARGPVMSERCTNCGKGRMDGRRSGPCCDSPQYESIPARGNVTNHHPTVKPLALMSWLITLITPAGGIVLDPFAGSGSTLCAAKAGGWRYVGIEREAEYVAIAEARLAATQEPRP